MKILAISDVHDEFEAFAPETLPDADVCLIAGDLTNFGQLERRRFASLELERLLATLAGGSGAGPTHEVVRAKQWLEALARRYPVFWIPGNHDIGVTAETFGEIPNCICLLNSLQTFDGFRLYGVSITPCYNAPFLAKQWDYMTADPGVEEAAFDFESVDIVVSHGPPYGCVDGGMPLLNGERPRLGSSALRNYIERYAPKLVLCGHIHEANGRDAIGKTQVVNVACSWRLLELE